MDLALRLGGEEDELVEHLLAGGPGQLVDVGGREALGGDRL